MNNIRVLTLREIAEMWSREAELPVSFMLRELRWATVNIPRLEQGLNLIPTDTPDEELPDPDERVDRDWLIEFCSKQGWEYPSFWQSSERETDRYPGRPTVKPAILHELQARFEENRLETSLAKQSLVLLEWANSNYAGDPRLPSTERTVENQIRDEYRRLKASLESEMGPENGA